MDSETEIYAEEHAAGVEQDLRAERDRLLKDTDFTQLTDAPVDRELWAAYRQQLRDLPTADGFPFVDLPDPPT